MAWDTELARELRKRDNPAALQPQIGEVISTAPLRIALLADAAILETNQIYLGTGLIEGHTQAVDLAGDVQGTATLTMRDVLKVGDLVACIPTAQTPKFLVISKVVIL